MHARWDTRTMEHAWNGIGPNGGHAHVYECICWIWGPDPSYHTRDNTYLSDGLETRAPPIYFAHTSVFAIIGNFRER